MGSITRVIGLASAVICSCAIATTANAAPETVKELVEKVYLPYTKYENPYQSIDKYEKKVRKVGCRIEEGRNGWNLYQVGNNQPCFKWRGVLRTWIQNDAKGMPTLFVLTKKHTSAYQEIDRTLNEHNPVDKMSDHDGSRAYTYQIGGLRYLWAHNSSGESGLTVRVNELPAASPAPTQNTKAQSSNVQSPKYESSSYAQRSNIENYQDDDGIGWLGYLAGALVLAFMGFSYYRNRQRIAQKIQNHEIWQGATKRQVLASWGKPDAIDKRPGPRVTWEGWYYGGQTENTAKRVVWFRKSSNKGEEGAQKWNIRR